MQLNEYYPQIIRLHRMRIYYNLDMKVFDASLLVLKYMHDRHIQSEFIINGVNHVNIVFESLNYQLNIRNQQRLIIGDGFENTAAIINEPNILDIINRIKTLQSEGNYDE